MATQNPKGSYSTEFIAGIISGALVGSLLALWYAPQSGEKTLDSIKRLTIGRAQQLSAKIQGESITQSIEDGRALAHQHRARQATPINK